MSAKSLHRSRGEVICSACFTIRDELPPLLAPPVYKLTPEEIAQRKAKKNAQEEAPDKAMEEMKAVLHGVYHTTDGKLRIVPKLEGLEEFCGTKGV